MNQILSTASLKAAQPQSIAEVRGALSFRPQNTKPVLHSSALAGGAPEVFFEVEEDTVPIGDMREIADTLSIDREGFELLRHTTAVEDLYDEMRWTTSITRKSRRFCANGSTPTGS